jgi:Spy/CpxP family protein refolding chaperone
MSDEEESTREQTPKPSRKTRYKAAAILAVVFLLGAAAGGAGMRAIMFQHWRTTLSMAPSEGRARFRLEAMARRLDLTDEQRAKVETVLVEAEKERARLTEDCRPQLEALRQKVEKEVDAILSEEQRVKHREMLERMRSRRWGPGRHGGPGMHGPPLEGPPHEGPPPAP